MDSIRLEVLSQQRRSRTSWNAMKSRRRPFCLPWVPILTWSTLLALSIPLFGGDGDKYVGGHVGFGFPLVTKDGGNVSTLADNFQMGLPVAITVNGPGRMYFDLELVPVIVDKPREIQLVVNPGFLWRFGHGFAAGSRVGFLLNSDQTKTAQFGITPLIVKSWPIEHSFFKGYFVEGDFIFRFNRPVNDLPRIPSYSTWSSASHSESPAELSDPLKRASGN